MEWRSKKFLGDQEKGALARGLYRSMGYSDNDFKKPFIAVVDTWNNICPGQFNLRRIAEYVRDGIYAAGGTPVEFGSIGCCDGIAQGHNGMHYILPSREIIASSVEVMMQAHMLDGMVLLGSCDKIVPGLLMAAARLNLPAIMVNGGPMYPGRYKGKDIDVNESSVYVGKFKSGKATKEELNEVEHVACPTPGSCQMIGTANTMSCLAEGMGMSLTGSAAIPTVDSKRMQVAKESGHRIVEMVKEGITARDIITRDSLENAVRLGMAIGGSTNLILHILAIAHEAKIDFQIEDFEQLSRTTPYIASLMTASPYDMVDFYEAGGVPAVMNQISHLLHSDAITVTGKTIGENICDSKILNADVIHPISKPYRQDGGLAILKGNLAPLSCVCKPAAIPLERQTLRGLAKVYDSEEALTKAIYDDEIKANDIIVVRYEGPKGGPGMREMFTPLELLLGYGIAESVFLITDGRFSGSNKGGFIGHISPEAAEGGPIAVVKNGDPIIIDIPNRRLDLDIPKDELDKRLAAWIQPEIKNKGGYLSVYSRLVKSAHYGAIIE
ncbi:dihydroxy-acid dehydratase [Megasphaera paucivorans]|uniref:Dihydroxy-acid dehydratase n=1 Tax=Megasphaera paucivorans TaxID=349095 RepID=A0A1H0AKS4_9FIRM|nr:dihydroxy-acid dehydratase [Megasphaera paucivorans]SDN33416.1 dihydroxyacid dehydratase [Megasphaera paucivorans]